MPHESASGPTSPKPTTVMVRMGVGAGVASPGALAGVIHLTADIGLWKHLAVGFEGVAMDSTTLALFEPAAGDSLSALRARVVGRLYFRQERLLLSAALAAGPGRYEAKQSVRCGWSDTQTVTVCAAHGPDTYLGTARTREVGLAYALELGLATRVGSGRIGGVLRVDGVNDDVGALTLGPTFSLEF